MFSSTPAGDVTLNHAHISTQSTTHALAKGRVFRTIRSSLNRVFRGRFFDVQFALVLALLVLVTKGMHGEGQATIFQGFLDGYIEETSASITRSIVQYNEPSDVNSLIEYQPLYFGGRGGESGASLDFSAVQQNSLIAYNPPSEDYIQSIGFERTGVIEYTVQPGDALSFIASDYGVTTSSLIWANDLANSDSISPGQKLKIPPVSGVIHTITSGDTVSSIAKKYSADEEEIIAFNTLPQDGQLQAGIEIVIPGGEIQGSTSTGSTATTAARFSYLPDLDGYFRAPTTGYNWNRIHGRNGVDIANSCGTPIYAAASGVIQTANGSGWNGGFGQFIKMEHPNGTETVYAHLSKVLTEQGSSAEKGQLIGLMGTTGRSTGCHLHFEVHGAKNPLIR